MSVLARPILGWLPKEPVAASTPSRTKRFHRLGVSPLAVAVVIFVIVGIGAELALLPRATSQSSVTTSGTVVTTTAPVGNVTPSTPVQTAVNGWLADFNSRNVNGIVGYYSNTASVVWQGNAAGLAGTYGGSDNIRILYGASIGKTVILNASLSNLQTKEINPDDYNVTMTVSLAGNSTVVGKLNASISAAQTWYYEKGAWQIQRESWTYNTFNVQYVISSTTFPQWAAMKSGQNPNLVSEKSFEWHAGPYVAASVYAVMFGVIAVGLLKFRSRPGY